MAAAAVSQQAKPVQPLPPTDFQSEPAQSAQDALPPTEYAQPASEQAEPLPIPAAKKPRNKKLIAIPGSAAGVLILALITVLVVTPGKKKPFDIEIAEMIFSSDSEYIDLSNMGLKNGDIENITNFTNLKRVQLDGNDFTDISIPANIPTLEEIDAVDNRISDISFIRDLKNMKILVLNNNLIRDISALSGCTSFYELDIGENDIADLSPLDGIEIENLYTTD